MGGGGGELRCEISQNAYIKLVMYARKHKTAAVNGVLVGRVSPQKNDVIEITDSVALFHAHSVSSPTSRPPHLGWTFTSSEASPRESHKNTCFQSFPSSNRWGTIHSTAWMLRNNTSWAGVHVEEGLRGT